ncbi:MAG: AAA family ATPase, partial [Actinomycetota bacterium]|nr:AAA family ATPase [Actinomycetota bacterium]
MDSPILATKLHAPARRASVVGRPRLTRRLSEPSRLTLVAAPAGFGKTSVLTEWIATEGAGDRVAWLSLDERDNDISHFCRYVLAAVERAQPGLTAASAELLATGSASTEAVLATLVNDLDADGAPLILVLDDLHAVEAPPVHDSIAFLIDNLPTTVRLVIASRSDPRLPLGRLRARGDLVELRAADLRFTAEESAAYLNGTMGLGVGATELAVLSDRTEGWIAALQLAALSLQGRTDAGTFISGFAG